MGSTDSARNTVLVVDDETDVRETLADILAWRGYDVREAANGQEAMASVSACRPCLILLDLMMPVMDGWEFCRRIAQDRDLSTVPVVIISGVTGMQPSAETLCVAAIATKPVDMPYLLGLVERYCHGQGLTTSAEAALPC